MRNRLFIILILFTTLVAGLNFPIGKMGLEYASPFVLLGIRFVAAGLLLLPFILKRPHPRTLNNWLKILVIGFLQTSLVMAGTYLSLKTISSSSTSILYSTNPIWFIVLSSLLLSRRYRPIQWMGVLLGFAGVIITQGFLVQFNFGAWYALLAGLAWAFSTILNNKWGASFDSWVLTAYQMLIGGVILFGMSILFEEPRFILSKTSLTHEILIFAYLILFSSIGQFISWLYVLKISEPGKASSYLFLIPLFGVLASWLLLGETIKWYVYAGAVCIATGIYLANKKQQ